MDGVPTDSSSLAGAPDIPVKAPGATSHRRRLFDNYGMNWLPSTTRRVRDSLAE